MQDINPLFITLIDEANKPILVHVMSDEAKDVNKFLQFNTYSNISLDFFESDLFQWTKISKNSKKNSSPIRMLFEVENVTVFGMWMKPIGLKIILGFNAFDKFENEYDPLIITVFDKVKKIYLRVKSNPFFNLDELNSDEIASKFGDKFEHEFATSVDLD
ncbi:TRAPP-associated protein Tca17p [Monosporozyma unispora]